MILLWLLSAVIVLVMVQLLLVELGRLWDCITDIQSIFQAQCRVLLDGYDYPPWLLTLKAQVSIFFPQGMVIYPRRVAYIQLKNKIVYWIVATMDSALHAWETQPWPWTVAAGMRASRSPQWRSSALRPDIAVLLLLFRLKAWKLNILKEALQRFEGMGAQFPGESAGEEGRGRKEGRKHAGKEGRKEAGSEEGRQAGRKEAGRKAGRKEKGKEPRKKGMQEGKKKRVSKEGRKKGRKKGRKETIKGKRQPRKEGRKEGSRRGEKGRKETR